MNNKAYSKDVMNAYRALKGPMPNVAPRTITLLGHRFSVNPTVPLRLDLLGVRPSVIRPLKSKAMTETEERAFLGKQIITKQMIAGPRKLRGDYGEQIITEYLSRNAGAQVLKLNAREANFPLDLATLPYKDAKTGKRIVEAIDVKAGEVVNTRGAQQWRVTLGEPGEDEKALLKTMSAQKKKTYNAKKLDYIMRRKDAEVARMRREYGPTATVIKSEYAVIINADSRTANIYRFGTFERQRGWNSREAESAFVTTVKLDFDPPQGWTRYSARTLKLKEARALLEARMTPAQFTDALRAMRASVDRDVIEWREKMETAMRTLLARADAEELARS